MTDPAARAHAIAERARLNPQQERQLHATADREQPREWYVVTRAGESREVMFCPPQTIGEVRTVWYPGAGVVPR